jgi:hypothetical protein
MSALAAGSVSGAGVTVPGTKPGINLSKMIRLDEVEDILSGMMQRLDSQEATITSLQRLVATLLPKAAAGAAFENVNDAIRDLSRRLDDVSAAATANLGAGRDMPAGELAYMNYLNLQELSSQVATCARQAETITNLQKLKDDTDAGLARLRSQCTPVELGESLRRAQIDTSSRVTTVESGLVNKVDRSEVGNLTSLASALESYSGFRTVTEAFVEQQRQWNRATDGELEAHSAALALGVQERHALREQAKLFATCEQLEELAAALRSVTGMTNLCAAKKTVSELYEIVRKEQERSSRAEVYARELAERISRADEAIATKASIEDNKKCVLRRHYDEAVTALGKDIDTKADGDSLVRTDGRVAVLEAERVKESARLSVAMRFVDWFTSRGENYEHNLRLVDKHLGKLTQAADPKARSPYEGQIRYAADMIRSETANAAARSEFGGGNAANAANIFGPQPTPTSNVGTSFSHML